MCTSSYSCRFLLLNLLILSVSSHGISLDMKKMISLFGVNCTAVLNISSKEFEHQHMPELTEESICECPPWQLWNNEMQVCKAKPLLQGIVLIEKTLQTNILMVNCMTMHNSTLSLGTCLYTSNALSGYFPLPCHASDLNKYMCANLKREGVLCSQCIKGYSLPVYSYDLKCVKCENYKYNWLKYIAVAFLPLTVFYFVITLLSISFTSPLMSPLVLFFQIMANPMQINVIEILVDSGLWGPKAFVMVMLPFFTLWNLDILRAVYPPFCLHPSVNTLHILGMDYLLAFFPLILIVLTYILVTLYDNNFKIVVWFWRPFRWMNYVKKQWNIKTSLIDVFASFIFLSSSRLLYASFNFLVPTYVYSTHLSDDMVNKSYGLLRDPTIKYFGKKHLPFALFALVVLILFIILPTMLLLLYPFQLFQRILNKMKLNTQTLHTFMDVFQGSFKNGKNGSSDLRFFSAFYLMIPLIVMVIISLTLSSFVYPLTSIALLIYCGLLAMFRPYKQGSHNNIAITLCTAALCTCLSIMFNIQSFSFVDYLLTTKESPFFIYNSVSNVFIYIFLAIPFFYLVGLLCSCFFFRNTRR